MLRLIHLTTLAELRARAAAWDDLWQRSDVTFPTVRAAHLAQWVEHFAPDADFHALVVEDAGVWVAALPLVSSKALRLLSVGRMPWAFRAGLLLDPRCDVEGVLTRLAAGIAKLPCQFFWLGEIPLDSPSWRAFHAAVLRAGLAASVTERHRTARLEIDHDWEAFERRLSKTFRKQTARLARRLAEAGDVRFRICSSFAPEAVETWLRRGFEVEHRSWKGRKGTSVFSRGAFPFYLREARQLAEAEQLHLAFLEVAGRPIAFAYSAVAKGVYHSLKIGYDEEYARYNPGQLLDRHLFEHLWRDPAIQAVNFVGVFAEAQRHWRPDAFRVGRMVVASRPAGRAFVYAQDHWLPRLRRVRQLRIKRTDRPT